MLQIPSMDTVVCKSQNYVINVADLQANLKKEEKEEKQGKPCMRVNKLMI